MQQLVEAAGRLAANRSVQGSGVTASYETFDDIRRVELSSEVMKKTGAATVTKSVKPKQKDKGDADEDSFASI